MPASPEKSKDGNLDFGERGDTLPPHIIKLEEKEAKSEEKKLK